MRTTTCLLVGAVHGDEQGFLAAHIAQFGDIDLELTAIPAKEL